MSHESKTKTAWQYLILILALVAIILSAIALTRAWLFQRKGLQTMTKVEVPYLYLKGHNSDTVSVELGEIDVRSAGEKRIPFKVEVNEDSAFKLQLGYTTNLPLSYKIVEVSDFENWTNVSANESNVVKGMFLNKDSTSGIADNTKHNTTYGNYDSANVQKNAEPVYWQSEVIPYEKTVRSYILIVNWKNSDSTVIDKDTDMIYLTAGITGETNETQTN